MLLISLGIDEHGFVAHVEGDDDFTYLRSERKFYEFMHYFEDEQFIFSLNTTEHRKRWVQQALLQLSSEPSCC